MFGYRCSELLAAIFVYNFCRLYHFKFKKKKLISKLNLNKKYLFVICMI